MQKIAFVCVHNSCRSQIAEALGKKLLPNCQVMSAGTQLKNEINPDAVNIMKKYYQIDMTKDQYPKLINELGEIDFLVTMGCNVNCPYIPNKVSLDFGLDDPSGKGEEEFLKTAQLIEEKILDLKNKYNL